jgi:uncharacterized membrane protein
VAVPPTAPSALLGRHLVTALALLAALIITTGHLQQASLWFDEGYTLYIVRDAPAARDDGLTAQVRQIFTSLRNATLRARADVHPPLYFVVLDAWTQLAGDAVYTVRLLSALAGLIGLAVTYRLGKTLFNHRTGLIAVAVLATACMFVYYNREARMYSLLLALAALATWVYVRWWRRPVIGRALFYGGLLALLAYTHYAGAFIVLTHGLHLLLTRPRRSWRILGPGVVALVLYTPWLPSLGWQLTTHGGPAASPFTDLNVALAALIYFVSGGYWGLHLFPLGVAVFHTRQRTRVLLLLLLWLLVTPAALLLLNHFVPAFFQVRYAIAVLPAAALLIGYGINTVLNLRRTDRIGRVITAGGGVLLLGILYTHLTVYPFVWPAKPDWDGAVQRMTAARQPLEPAITLIPDIIPAAYYDRLYGIRQGIALDLNWRWQEPDMIADAVAHMGSAESVWLVMPSTFVSTWDAVRHLLADREVGYRDSVMNLVLYRFDRGTGGDLRFDFADFLAYDGGIRHVLYALPGEDFCFTLALAVLKDFAQPFAVDYYLTQGYGTIRALQTEAIGQPAGGMTLNLQPCLPIAPDAPSGPYHLHLRIYNQSSGQTLPLLENGETYWSDSLVLGLVHVGSG